MVPVEVEVHPHGFSLAGTTGTRAVPVHGNSQLPLLVAALHAKGSGEGGVPVRELWPSVFRSAGTRANFIRTLDRNAREIEALLRGADGPLLRISRGAGPFRDSIQLAYAEGVTLKVAPTLKASLQASFRDDVAPWQLLPIHDSNQLVVFVNAIQGSAAKFDDGAIETAAGVLQASHDDVLEPRYRSVLLFRTARALLRLG